MAVVIKASSTIFNIEAVEASMLKSEKQVRQLTGQQQFHIRLRFQCKELEEHKYYLSEKHGINVELNQSIADWVSSGHAERFARDFSKKQDCIFTFCSLQCDDKKCNVSCRLSLEKIHDLMDD
jgi:hypothetical protein